MLFYSLIIIALWLFLFLAASAWLLVLIFSKNSKISNKVWPLLLLSFLSLIAWCSFNVSETELSPLVKDKNELTGIWQYDDSQLMLKTNGSYSCSGIQCSELGINGQWQRKQDFYITFTSASGNSIEWRIIKKRNKYQFLQAYDIASDITDGDVTFIKRDASQAQ